MNIKNPEKGSHNMKQPSGIFWQTDAEIESWSVAATAHLKSVLGAIFENLSVGLLVPDAITAKHHATANLDLLGKVILKWNEMPAEAVTLEIPLPYHGLFIKRQEKTGLAGFAVWGSWLGERTGFRYFRKHGEAKEVFWRVGLPGGSYVQSPCGPLSNKEKGHAFPENICILPSREAWPSFLQRAYDLNGLVDFTLGEEKEEESGGFWRLINDLATKAHTDAQARDAQETDEDELNHRVLVTFPVWLQATLARALVTTLLEVSGVNTKALLQAIKHRTAIDNELARSLWQSLLQMNPSEALAMRLRPRNWSRGSEDEGKNRFAPLQWVDPTNPVDLAALLTQVRRYPMAHSVLANLPANYRQNHPSFRGCICPVQSPESELVGLSLQLARGAKVNWEGIISPADRTKPIGELGLGAGLVPFYEHNDGARCMMGAKNLRQAVPVAGRQSPLVKTGGEEAVQQLVNPLVEIGACPAAVDEKGAPALGVDLLVAYLPWKGMNVDDAIVVGQQVVGRAVSDDRSLFRREQTDFQEGLLDIQISQRFKVPVEPGWKISWLAPEGSVLFGGDLIARFELQGGKKDIKREVLYQDRSPARVKSIRPPNVPEWMRGTLNYELVKYLNLGVGDKLMGRHGNKGVVGAILPANQMPRLPKDKRLPAELQDRPIDIVLNPHGVISRMNLGQLLETHVGWLLKAGCKPEQLLKNGVQPDEPIGQPFLQALDHAKVQQLLGDTGLDRFGRIQLVLPDGTRTLAPVVVGFQHIVRLKHVPELKSQARRGGEGAIYSRDTGQAIHGRLIGGGQRVGEMEVWALAGYQADHILEEMLGVKADSILAGHLPGAEPKVTQKTFEGFPQRLKDWLFSLLIDLRAEDRRFGFSFMDAASARKRIGERKKVINSASVKKLVLASFSCQSKMKGGCPFELLDGARIAVEEPFAKSNQVSLNLEEFLDHLGLVIDGPLRRKGSGYYVRLCFKAEPSSDGTLTKAFDLEKDRIAHAQGFARPAGLLKVSITPTNDQVKATIAIDPKDKPANWPDSVKELPLYAQFTRPSSTFSVGDIVDVPRFIARLKKKTLDAIAAFLVSRLSDETKRCLDVGPEATHLLESLVADLNEVVSGESIYEEQRFGSVRLRPETSQLLNSNPRRKGLRKLNRMLLEDAFPDMLARGKSGPEASNMDGSLVLRAFLKHTGTRRFGQMSVACPNGHNTTPLKGKAPFGEKLGIAAGGFFDESLFGSFKAAGTIDDKKNWAYIELPVEVPYPVAAFLGPNEEVNKFLEKHEVPREKLPPVRVIPVLPPRYRMLFLGSNSATRDPLIQDGYAPILRATQQYEMAADDAKKAEALRVLTNAVEDLFRLVARRLSGKEGLIRRDGLGRRVDCSARLVIIPNPELRWDEAGVPTAVLLELMGPELKRWMKEKRESGDLIEMASVLTADNSDAAILEGWSWRKSGKDRALLDQGHRLLSRFLKDHPEVLIVLNRQPSLHRNSIQAFRPKPLLPEVGEVLQLSPLVCKGFGADFDGDEMAIHVPLSAASRADAATMLPSRNMLSLATGEVLPAENDDDKSRIKSRYELGLPEKSFGVLAQYEQDFVLGLYWASRKESGFRERLLEILPEACCREWVGGHVLDQKNGSDLLEHLVKAHRDAAAEVIWKLSNLAYECCSKLGVSFGFYELTKLASQCREQSTAALKGVKDDVKADLHAQLNKLVQKPLLDLVKQGSLDGGKDIFERPGLHFAAMAFSGARGKQQVRQLIGARGVLDPGKLDFDCPTDRFLVQSALANGMSSEEAFFGAMNSRSSMCDKKLGTRKAGYLTRRLVTALWPVGVVEDDCGNPSESRSPVTCLCTEGICAACYGDLPGAARPAIGFPAGLIAAQSIGERGTQLSMQSFHTTQRVFSMQDVQRSLDHTGDIGAVFTREDLLDLEALVARFKQPSESDKLSQYLTAKLKGQTKQLLKEFTGGENRRVERAVLGILNRALKKVIYDPQRFEGITLPPEIVELIEATRRPQKPDHAKQPETPKKLPSAGLNRMLLECAYPRELAEKPRFFYHPRFAPEFVQRMKEANAYKGLDDRHLEILWRAIHKSPEKSLSSVTKSGGLLTRIAFERQRRHILLAACKNESASTNEPAARVLFNLFGSRTREDERKSK